MFALIDAGESAQLNRTNSLMSQPQGFYSLSFLGVSYHNFLITTFLLLTALSSFVSRKKASLTSLHCTDHVGWCTSELYSASGSDFWVNCSSRISRMNPVMSLPASR